MEYRTNINLPRETDGANLLLITSEIHNMELLQLLLKKSARINQSNNYGETPLYITYQKRNKEMVELLLKKWS